MVGNTNYNTTQKLPFTLPFLNQRDNSSLLTDLSCQLKIILGILTVLYLGKLKNKNKTNKKQSPLNI